MYQALNATVLLPLLLSAVASHGGETVSAPRQQELVYLLRQDCGSCHGMTLRGGLGPALLPEALAGKPRQYLAQVISKGVAGTAMPPWENILEAEEIEFLVTYLQMGAEP